MDIGSAATTEFEVTADVASYMLDNDLLDCKQALIHSHNTIEYLFDMYSKHLPPAFHFVHIAP